MPLSEKQKQQINNRLLSLEQEKKALIQAVEGYAKDVMSAGEAWLEGRGLSSQKFSDISNMLSSVQEFFIEAADLISAGPILKGGENLLLAVEHSSPSGTATATAMTGQEEASSSLTSDLLIYELCKRVKLLESSLTSEEENGMKEKVNKLETVSALTTQVKRLQKKIKRIENDECYAQALRDIEALKTWNQTNRNKDMKVFGFGNFESRLCQMEETAHEAEQRAKCVEQMMAVWDNGMSEVPSRMKSLEESLNRRFNDADEKITKLTDQFGQLEKEKDGTICLIIVSEEKITLTETSFVSLGLLENRVQEAEKILEKNIKIREVSTIRDKYSRVTFLAQKS